MTTDPQPPDGPPPDEPEELPFGLPLDDRGPDEVVPVVIPVAGGDIPVAEPVRRPRPQKPQPQFGWGLLWTLGFAFVLFGVVIGVLIIAVIDLVVSGDKSLQNVGDPNKLPPSLAGPLAFSFGLSYACGLIFALIALRIVAGRDWARQIGLRRPPLLHVALALVALPGFVLASDGLAQLFTRLFGMPEGMDQAQMLRDMFSQFPWWCAVLAIGVGPGVVEELWCRGFLGRGFVGRYGWVGGVLLASLFFGLLHMFPPWYVLVTACMGVGLHLIYLASRSLWVPIILHALNNSIAALGATGHLPLEQVERNAEAAPALVYLLAVGLLVFVGVAMATARVRVVPVDPNAPPWEPPFPGVVHPPPGANARLQTGCPSPAAVVFALAILGVLVYLLSR
jgi:membrane protease YdiL (CAAX protease family)